MRTKNGFSYCTSRMKFPKLLCFALSIPLVDGGHISFGFLVPLNNFIKSINA